MAKTNRSNSRFSSNIPLATSNGCCSGQGCLYTILAVLLLSFFYIFGSTLKDQITSTELILVCVGVLALLVLYGYSMNKRHVAELNTIKQQREELNQLAEKYNNEVKKLQNSGISRHSGEKQYYSILEDYELNVQAIKQRWKSFGQSNLSVSRSWKRIFILGFAVIGITFGTNMGLTADSNPKTTLMESRSWNADNIPMPHMQDHSLYVSNPDSILSEQVVHSINKTLGLLDDSLGIESVMAIVGHIDNDDPVAMVRGIYQKYKVGRNDRGLVIVVGYLDHSYFIAPGRSLEADLTDLECNHLAQDYLIPSMKAEKPDSGMLYLARGVFALMSGKERPKMSSFVSGGSNTTDEEEDEDVPLYILAVLIVLWGIYSYYMGCKVGTSLGVASLMANPFVIESSSSGGSSSSWGGGSSSSSSSGGFGGGSWGGGGSGGRW
jgi:uncharacterized membrane protein YgcG